MTYTYEIDSSIDFSNIIDALKKELNLKEGQINYFSYEDDEEVEENLSIDELKDKAMDIFFEQDEFSIIFPNVEVNLSENSVEIISEIKLTLNGIDIESVVSDEPEANSKSVNPIKLNLDNLKFDIFLDPA